MNLKPSKNITNLLSFLVIGFMPYLINLFLLPLYSRFLSEEDFGVIGLALAFLFITTSWSNFQLPGAIPRIYFDYVGTELKQFVSTLINSSIIVCLIFCLVYWVFSDILVKLIYGSEDFFWIHIFVVLSVFLSCTSSAFERLMITQQKGLALLARSLVSHTVSIASGVYFICYLQLGAVGFILSQSVYFFSILVFSFFMSKELYALVLKRKYFYEGLRFSYPLIFHALGGVIFMYSGAFFVKSLVSIAALGVFTIADRFSQIPKAVVNSFNNVYSPIYNKVNISGDSVSELSDSAQIFWSIVFAIFSAYFVFVAAAFIDEYMIGEYSQVKNILLILVPAYFFRSMFCFSSAPIFYHKDTHYIPIITCFSGLIILILSYPVIKFTGMLGAALLVALGFFLTFVLAELISRRKYLIHIFKRNSAFSFMTIFVFNLFVMRYLDIDGFFAVSGFSAFAAVLNLTVVYYFNIFGFKSSIVYLRRINE